MTFDLLWSLSRSRPSTRPSGTVEILEGRDRDEGLLGEGLRSRRSGFEETESVDRVMGTVQSFEV